MEYNFHHSQKLNLISTSSQGNHVLKWKIEKQRKKGKVYMYFQIVLNLICMLSYENIMCISICLFAVNRCILFHMCLCLLLLSMTLFMGHLLPSCEVSKDMICVSLSGSVLLPICLSLLSWTFTFRENSGRPETYQPISDGLGCVTVSCVVSVYLSVSLVCLAEVPGIRQSH